MFDVAAGTKGGSFGIAGPLDENGLDGRRRVPFGVDIVQGVHHVERQGIQGLGVVEFNDSEISRNGGKDFGGESHAWSWRDSLRRNLLVLFSLFVQWELNVCFNALKYGTPE